MPRVRDLIQSDRETLAANREIKRLYRALHSFQTIILDDIRNARTPQEASQRAEFITEQIRISFTTVLGPAATGAGSAQANAARINADRANRCSPPRVWDPITETCVLM